MELVQAGAVQHVPEDYIDLAAYTAAGGYKLLRECLLGERDVESVIATMEASGLRGLGGAGFPAGRKWRIVRAEPAPRLMAVNIDEGEPGTFKDRVYLERDPHRFIEGMLIAAWAVGIDGIYIYLRDEYHGCRALLEQELARLKADPPVAGMPHIELRRGAGAYICGEESAMIESIEGKRGMPRLRPPVRGPGRAVRAADAGTQLRDAVLGARPDRKRRRVVQLAGTARPQGPAFVLGLRAREGSGRQAGAGRHHDPGADRRILRRHAGGPPASTPTCRAAPRAASCRRA